MAHLSIADVAARTKPMADEPKRKGWVKKSEFKPGGHKGKLHRELGIPEGQKIGKDRLEKAAHSRNPEVRRDAIRAQTMGKWHHGARKKSVLHDHPRSEMKD